MKIIGTPEFIAPEMMSASGELSLPSVDLYALGIMLHDTIVGEPPWRGDIKEILNGHMNVVPPRLSDRRKDALIPRELDELAAQLLKRTRTDGPQRRKRSKFWTRFGRFAGSVRCSSDGDQPKTKSDAEPTLSGKRDAASAQASAAAHSCGPRR